MNFKWHAQQRSGGRDARRGWASHRREMKVRAEYVAGLSESFKST
jgi:hypothetical protein